MGGGGNHENVQGFLVASSWDEVALGDLNTTFKKNAG